MVPRFLISSVKVEGGGGAKAPASLGSAEGRSCLGVSHSRRIITADCKGLQLQGRDKAAPTLFLGLRGWPWHRLEDDNDTTDPCSVLRTPYSVRVHVLRTCKPYMLCSVCRRQAEVKNMTTFASRDEAPLWKGMCLCHHVLTLCSTTSEKTRRQGVACFFPSFQCYKSSRPLVGNTLRPQPWAASMPVDRKSRPAAPKPSFYSML